MVSQAVRDCLQEAMDHDGLASVLERIHAGALTLVARDTPEPSCFAHEILNANPYAFLDDAPLEERRTQAVYARRTSEPASSQDLGALDASAIARVRDEERVFMLAGFAGDRGLFEFCRQPPPRNVRSTVANDQGNRPDIDRLRLRPRVERKVLAVPRVDVDRRDHGPALHLGELHNNREEVVQRP